MSSSGWGGLVADTRVPRLLRTDEADETAAERRARLEIAGGSENLRETRALAEPYVALPGHGESGAGCGEWYPREFCSSCGEPHFGKSVCMNRGCPDCWWGWRQDRAYAITRRLSAAREAAESGLQRRAVHAVMSPPEGEITSLQDIQSGFRDAYDLAKEKGVRGGVAIFHGFRVLESVKREFEEIGPDCGLWTWVRENEQPWREQVYWSPHYHIIGLSAEFGENKPDEQDGWVAKRIRSMESHRKTDLDGYQDVANLSKYLLSHATFEEGESKDCIRWFGSVAPGAFSAESELSPGTLSVIERYAAEAAEAVAEGEEGEAGEQPDDEPETCERCGEEALTPIWDAGLALQDRDFCEQIGPEAQRRLQVAFEWAIGEVVPPPGLRSPGSEEEAREVLDALQ